MEYLYIMYIITFINDGYYCKTALLLPRIYENTSQELPHVLHLASVDWRNTRLH